MTRQETEINTRVSGALDRHWMARPIITAALLEWSDQLVREGRKPSIAPFLADIQQRVDETKNASGLSLGVKQEVEVIVRCMAY